MEKELSIKILKNVLAYLDMNPKQLSDSIGKERAQWAYDVLNPKKKVGISKDIADMITNKYPQINKSYLLTGEPPMLKPDADKQKQRIANGGIAGAMAGAVGAATGGFIGAVASAASINPLSGIASSLLKLLSQYDEALSAERNMREKAENERMKAENARMKVENDNEQLRLEISELKSKLQ